MNLLDLLPQQWKIALPCAKERLAAINLADEFIPAKNLIFKALEFPIPKIKVCIVGQDPYPNPSHAMGLAFSVPNTVVKLPPTLRNIFKELETDLGVINQSGDLSKWQDQGVLLLNRVLTTSPGISQGHKDLGWDKFTEEIIRYLAAKHIVFLLWGRSSGALAPFIAEENLITGVHPSPLSAYRGFFGSKPFSEINSRLNRMGISEIDWRT